VVEERRGRGAVLGMMGIPSLTAQLSRKWHHIRLPHSQVVWSSG
jgi:hypothetical protein